MENPFKNRPHEYQRHGGGELEYDMFYREIDRLIAEGNPHFAGMTPEDEQQLTAWDVRTWMLVAGGRSSEREFAMRKRTMETELEQQSVRGADHPRRRLYAYLGDVITDRIAADQLKEMAARKKEGAAA